MTRNSRCLLNKSILMKKNNQNTKNLIEELLDNEKNYQQAFDFLAELRHKISKYFQNDEKKMSGKLKWLAQIKQRANKLTNVGRKII
ncbi:hypothetical protein MHK_007429 [Candidatus Magnetomorum sp. HK-1]|nr:hypothetical protein MHK_007429 [Candidatus Magnetomorum sp. HK-1]